MGTISRYNSVQFENLNANELVGVTLVYKSVNRQGKRCSDIFRNCQNTY